MVKFPSIFTLVSCPECGVNIDRKLNPHALTEHIHREHPSIQLKPFIEKLFKKLGLHMPDNIDEISKEELLNILENMAQYEATRLRLKQLRRERGWKQIP